MIAATDPEVTAFLTAWHEAGRAVFERMYDSLNYDTYYPKTAHERKKYIALDYGAETNRSGKYLLDRTTGDVYSIKAYGVPNRRLDTLAGLTARMVPGLDPVRFIK